MRRLKHFSLIIVLATAMVFLTSTAYSQENEPVSPNASPEAKALLKLLYDISGKYTLTGQHNFPNIKGRNTQFAAKYIGKTPVVYSIDMGFARDGDTDSYLARPQIVKEVIEQHRLGSIITICWHAVPPTADEPVTFRPQGKAAPESLASIQGKLLDKQFEEILTPGTDLNRRWQAQVDSVAFYLKKLQQAGVPILWRPYHEMNGGWFWWGGRTGKYSTKALYRQLFDRYVHHHKLNNLIWVWNVDRPNNPDMHFSKYYPGNEYLDVLSLDVYNRDFNQSYYDSLMVLSKGKPFLLGEVGNPPMPEILDKQPNWTLYSTWAGMVRYTSKKDYKILMNDPGILSLEDSAYWQVSAEYRKVSGIDPLPDAFQTTGKIDFTGEWIFDEEESILDNFGPGFAPYKLQIKQSETGLNIQSIYLIEYAENRIEEQNLKFDGSEFESKWRDAPMITTAAWSENNDTLFINSRIVFNRGKGASEMILKDKWTLDKQGEILLIKQYSKSFWGKRNTTLAYRKW
ncbi:MAG: hypothetical protein JXR46_16955 [Calditrichaceae bacterium]|nr:hypothetical protein [Calditrichaceae bacterium]MBN2710738.1 hypothetical protein [Calditrichaceae bacterium]RQV95691.1 MAG: hypothetical protein EH224_06650 [Calditrichota bacterium]